MRPIDVHIRRAVWLVLAACRPSESKAPIVTVEPPADAGTLTVASSEPVDAAPPSKIAPPPNASPLAICRAYRQSVTGTPNDGRVKTPVRTRSGPTASQDWGQKRADGSTECRIVWSTEEADVKIWVSPTCCPPHTTPCPPPYEQTVRGERLKVETAIVGADLVASSSTLEWVTSAPQPPRHYCGRRPEGFDVDSCSRSAGAIAADMAALEAASVFAFERLARELGHHGAPSSLVRRARSAAKDEARHARVMCALALRLGVVPTMPERRELPVRALPEVALENAIEGCARETFGAAVATFQAERAEDPRVRAALRSIARDEREHAALAWDVHDWIAEVARELVPSMDAARRATVAAMRHEEPAPTARRTLGLPTRDESSALAAAVART